MGKADNGWRDLNVRETILFHGNYCPHAINEGQLMYSVSSAGQQWDPNIVDRGIPNSLYTTKADLALMLVREACIRVGTSPANTEIIASIDRRMIQRENSGRN